MNPTASASSTSSSSSTPPLYYYAESKWSAGIIHSSSAASIISANSHYGILYKQQFSASYSIWAAGECCKGPASCDGLSRTSSFQESIGIASLARSEPAVIKQNWYMLHACTAEVQLPHCL
jgi:hypothetical protein